MKRANAIHIVVSDPQNLLLQQQQQQEETLNKIPFSNTDRYSPKPINYNTMDMNPNWREKYVYPIAGLATIAVILYFTVSDYQFEFEFPTVLWQNKMGFVGVNSTRFVVIDDDHQVVNGRKGKEEQKQSGIYFNGWNSYWLMEKSVWEPSRSRVSEMLKRGAQMGMNVCRVWAFNDGPGANSVQISPGVFNERALKGLDYVIVEARKHGIRLILSLVNNLNVYGGKEQYVKWAQEAGLNVSSSDDSFFSEPVIKEYYKNYIKAIITRRNSRSGIRYSDEPAIFAWELINEPRCDSDPSSCKLQAWIAEMAAYVKSLDQNHLVTVGLEGFYGPNGPKAVDRSAVNPGDWAASLGTDFLQNSAVEGIDFASVHAYPDSWLPHANATEKLNFIIRWVDSHISDAEYILKKPVLFTEVGCPLHGEAQGFYNRDTVLRVVYDRVSESAKKGQAGSGALIWQLLVEGMEEYGDRFSLVAWENPSTYKLMVEQSCRLKSSYSESKSTVNQNEKDLCSGLVPQLRT